jgi:hypothetical protein
MRSASDWRQNRALSLCGQLKINDRELKTRILISARALRKEAARGRPTQFAHKDYCAKLIVVLILWNR